jgi:PAS domain S-box-containing protein
MMADAGTTPSCEPGVPGLDTANVYALVAESVRDYAIFLLDTDGIIRCWGESARLMKWWTRAEAEGAHLRLLYPDGGAEDGTAEAHLQRAAETGEYNGEGHRVRSDGSTFWAYVTLTALRTPDGTLVGFTKVTRDFSARRAVESAHHRDRQVSGDAQQLVEEAQRIKRLVANLSHELRTPLNVIVGSIALLEQRAPADGPERAHIERLRRNSRHLLSIIDDVLELSRMESGQMTIAGAVHAVGSAMEEALADVEPYAAQSGVTVINAVSGAAAELSYWGDEGRVRQILVNLLTNAVKFTGAGGRITISGGTGETVVGATLAGPGPWIFVRVEDTGRGIPAERLDTIFDPFQQSEPTDQSRGTGLGLSISRQLAREMGGDLVADSTLGVGSRFTLWLPITATERVPR